MRMTGEVARFAIGVGATLALAVSAVLAQAPPAASGPATATQFPPSPPEVVAAMLKLAGVTKETSSTISVQAMDAFQSRRQDSAHGQSVWSSLPNW